MAEIKTINNMTLADTVARDNITKLNNSKADKTDNTLETDAKTIVGAINEINKKIQNVSSAKIGEISLNSSGWIGDTSPYSQVVNVTGVTKNSQVDLTPSVEQLAIFYEKDITFVTENDGGIVTVYAIGQKPQNDYIIQVTITEVSI